jgi:hypothetical protein
MMRLIIKRSELLQASPENLRPREPTSGGGGPPATSDRLPAAHPRGSQAGRLTQPLPARRPETGSVSWPARQLAAAYPGIYRVLFTLLLYISSGKCPIRIINSNVKCHLFVGKLVF